MPRCTVKAQAAGIERPAQGVAAVGALAQADAAGAVALAEAAVIVDLVGELLVDEHPQTPFALHVPVQQSLSRVQLEPRGMHWQVVLQRPVQQVPGVEQAVPMSLQVLQVPLSQRPLQQSVSPVQLPVDLHWQTPPTPQIPVQQSEGDLQAASTTAQAQVPVLKSQLPEQQSSAAPQVLPGARQAHLPDSHLRVQHWPFLVQLVPPALQRHCWKNGLERSQLPEQHSPLAPQVAPGPLQHRLSTHTWGSGQPLTAQPLVEGTQLAPDFMKPPSQTKSQTPPVQVAVPWSGSEHGVQELPQESGLALARQMSLQAWNPALQLTPHTPALQVALPDCGTGQGSHPPQ